MTFLIMIFCWGTVLLFSINGIILTNNYFLYIPYFIGGFSPTIASYIVIKLKDKNTKFKDWLVNIFDFKHNIFSYILVVVFSVLFILPQCLICGYQTGAPLYTILFMIPIMLFGGGLEEAGWRYILQPELEKKYNFVISTLIVSVIWWLWHLPLFYIQGVGQFGQNFFIFGINVLGLSFALACIRKTTKSVWLCVLFHCIINSLSGIYIVNDNILGNFVSAVILIFVSLILVKIKHKKENI
jgi:membrane protease YdiL (CAAX protease family)